MAKNTKSLKASLLVYDIPSALDYPNPSGFLRRVGFRVNLSAWVVTDASTPWNLLNEMTGEKIDWKLFPFAPEATESLVKTCREAIAKEIADAQQRHIESLAEAQLQHRAAYDTARGERDLSKCEKSYASKTKALVKRANALIDDLTEAARVFGLEADTLPFADARQQVRALSSTAKSRAHLYAEMTEAVQGTPMEAAANDNAVPAGIMADYIEEAQSRDMSNVRNAFAAFHANGEATNGIAVIAEPAREVQSSGSPQRTPRNGHRVVNQRSNSGREYTVRTRNGNRTVRSTMTTDEAAEICNVMGDNLARDIARRARSGRNLSPAQRAWLHVLANEYQAEARAQNDAEGGVATAVIPEVSTQRMHYNTVTRVLSVDASDLQMSSPMPEVLNVRSHRTNAVTTFTRTATVNIGDEVTHTEYRNNDQNITLRIVND